VTAADGPDQGSLVDALNWEARRTSAFTGLLNRAVAARLGINPTDLEIAGLIGVTGPVTPGRLAELTGLATGTITLVADRLERAGFARRVPDPADRRSVVIELLPDRASEAAELFAPARAAGNDLAAGYSDSDLALITGYLRLANDRLRDAAAALMRAR
jgi:DNA-binding MarR family transcriptional regulator